MANATIVTTWQDASYAYMAVRVENDTTYTESDPITGIQTQKSAAVEYIGKVPLKELEGLTNSGKKTKLAAACKAVRDAQKAGATSLSITGTVTL